jgi:hypothetical protein
MMWETTIAMHTGRKDERDRLDDLGHIVYPRR